MNRDRRKQLRAISDELEELRGRVAFLKEEEDAYIESIPDNMEQKRDEAETAAEGFDEVDEMIESAIEAIAGLVR